MLIYSYALFGLVCESVHYYVYLNILLVFYGGRDGLHLVFNVRYHCIATKISFLR